MGGKLKKAFQSGFAQCEHSMFRLCVQALAAVGLVGAVGFRPTIRISHSDRTSEAKWDSSVLVDACRHSGQSSWHYACMSCCCSLAMPHHLPMHLATSVADSKVQIMQVHVYGTSP